MKICMIGGTGLLGCEAAKQLIAKGHQVSTLALPPLPEGAPIPEEMEIIFQDINKWTDEEVENWLKGADALFAAGVDERVEFEAPVLPKYHKFNIAPLERIFPLCKKVGVKHATVLGSYFSYWAKMHTEGDLVERNPYFKSRLAQEKFCEDSCDENFSVDVLELPYLMTGILEYIPDHGLGHDVSRGFACHFCSIFIEMKIRRTVYKAFINAVDMYIFRSRVL